MQRLVVPDQPALAGLDHGVGVAEALQGAGGAPDHAVELGPDPVLGALADLVAGGAALEHLLAVRDEVVLRQGRAGGERRASVRPAAR